MRFQTEPKTKRKICVVLVVDDLGLGGAERQVVELANNIDSDLFEVHVCALSNHIPLSSKLRHAEHRLHVITKKHRFDCTVVPRLARLLRVLKADIVHGYLFSAEIASRLAGHFAGTRVVVGSERNANRVLRMRNWIAYRLTQRYVDITIANSNAGAVWNASVFRQAPSHYRVIHNGIDTERFRPADGKGIRQELGIPLECPVIGVFANFKPWKNHQMVFRAFKRVLECLPEARLLLVGNQVVDAGGRFNSYKTELNRLVDDIKIRPRCLFLGHQEETEHLYPLCDITALSSLHEGTPNVLLESMACEVPVVATNVCDNSYVVRDGETGFLVEVDDVERMADRIQVLLSNDALRQEVGQTARKWMLAEFSLEKLARNTEAIYVEALGKERNGCNQG